MGLKYNGWNTLPIGKYFKMKELFKESNHLDIELVALLCDMKVDDVMNMPISEVRRLIGECMWVRDGLKVGRKKFDKVILDGVKYNIYSDFKNITAAQYIDFNTFFNEDKDKYYCNILTCFIIPDGHKYNDGYDAAELAEYFKEHLDIETAENACFFFAMNSRRSIRRGLLGLIWKVGMMEMRERNLGIRESLRVLREKLTNQKELIDGLDLSIL